VLEALESGGNAKGTPIIVGLFWLCTRSLLPLIWVSFDTNAYLTEVDALFLPPISPRHVEDRSLFYI
jgi:hypothetical protein